MLGEKLRERNVLLRESAGQQPHRFRNGRTAVGAIYDERTKKQPALSSCTIEALRNSLIYVKEV